MNRRRMITLTTAVALLAGMPLTAGADDDPQPIDWPRVEAPGTDGRSDPEPVDWPRPQQY